MLIANIVWCSACLGMGMFLAGYGCHDPSVLPYCGVFLLLALGAIIPALGRKQ